MSNLDDLLLQYKAETGENTDEIRAAELSYGILQFMNWLIDQNATQKKYINQLIQQKEKQAAVIKALNSLIE